MVEEKRKEIAPLIRLGQVTVGLSVAAGIRAPAQVSTLGPELSSFLTFKERVSSTDVGGAINMERMGEASDELFWS